MNFTGILKYFLIISTVLFGFFFLIKYVRIVYYQLSYHKIVFNHTAGFKMLKAALKGLLKQFAPSSGSTLQIIELLTYLLTGRLGVDIEVIESLDRPLTLNILLMLQAHHWQHDKLLQWDNVPLTVR